MHRATFPFLILFCLATASFIRGEESVVINAGIPGNRTTNLLKRIDKDVLAHQPTCVVLMVGTNDRLNSGGFVDADSYRKNVRLLTEKIRSSGADLVLVTPPPCLAELLFTRHDPAKFADQAPAARMEEVRSILLDIAAREKVGIVDFHRYLVDEDLAENDKKSVLRNLSNSGSRDGVHFTPAGYRMLAEHVAEEIAARDYDVSVVVCFGDSLTHGPSKEDVKTVTGDNYPAFLKTILNGGGAEKNQDPKGSD